MRLKRLREKLVRYPVYRNMFLSFFFLTCLVVCVFCFAVYAFFSKSTLEEVGNVSESMLAQTSYVADIIHTQVYDIGNHLINDQHMVSAMFNKKIDRIQEYRVVSALSALQSTYPFIKYIGVYNGATERYMNNKGIAYEDERALIEGLGRAPVKEYSRFVPRKVHDPVSDREVNVLTFVLSPGFTSYFPKNGGIVINVDEQYIKELLVPLMNERTGFLIVTDEDGTILSRTNEEHFLENAAGEPYIRSILSSGDRSGSFLAEIEGEKRFVSFVKSEALRWNFISVNDYDELLFNMTKMRQIVLSLALLLCVLGVLLSYWLTNHMYNPLEHLMKRIAGLQKGGSAAPKRANEFLLLSEAFHAVSEKATQLEPAMSVMQMSRLLQAMKGSSADPANRFVEALGAHEYKVVLLKLDGMKTFKRMHDEKTQSLIRFAVCNIAHELTGLDAVITEEDEIGLAGRSDAAAFPHDLPASLQEVQRVVLQYFRLSLTIAIGPDARGAGELRSSYLAASELLQRRFMAGGGCIFGVANPEERNADGNESVALSEKKLIERIQTLRRADVGAEIRGLFDEVRRLPYDQAMLALNQLLVSLYRYFDAAVPGTKEEARSFLKLASGLVAFEAADELAERIEAACLAICDALEAKTKHRHHEVIDEIKAYAQANYAKHDLSLEALADRFQITPGYLGKLFKSACGVSFSDYLRQARLDKACDLLLHTRDPANVISEKVGILNSTYFYTVFKKKYGVSPVQYRTDAIKRKLLQERANATNE
ncbi:AraC family transcriptional regulator [Paenibacillus sp.]|uniref:AraC family transcriptional regulator n=1 Tax=Paenibacillus sp. TaxID=58172 RepID=UPI0028127388|nr:AraC family transcriptional regulator [Paenibacillus sp.]